MRVVQAPPIQFKCQSCGATNEGEPHEFEPLPTMPPTWRVVCAFCRCASTCSPPALIAKLVGAMGPSEILATLNDRLGRMGL